MASSFPGPRLCAIKAPFPASRPSSVSSFLEFAMRSKEAPSPFSSEESLSSLSLSSWSPSSSTRCFLEVLFRFPFPPPLFPPADSGDGGEFRLGSTLRSFEVEHTLADRWNGGSTRPPSFVVFVDRLQQRRNPSAGGIRFCRTLHISSPFPLFCALGQRRQRCGSGAQRIACQRHAVWPWNLLIGLERAIGRPTCPPTPKRDTEIPRINNNIILAMRQGRKVDLK
mmetsp:Transcript_13470/g.33039  ORF Transcript_13470/g.33039 Transcript_13470/m.33039 type:complete len:225 (-) Transcript_13470:85-759(-)